MSTETTEATEAERPDTTADHAPEPVRAAIVDGDGMCVNVAVVPADGSFDPGEGLHLEPLRDDAPVAVGWTVDAQGSWNAPRASPAAALQAGTLEDLQAQLDRIRAALTEPSVAATWVQDYPAAIARGAVTVGQLTGALRWGVITEGEHHDLITALEAHQEAHRE